MCRSLLPFPLKFPKRETPLSSSLFLVTLIKSCKTIQNLKQIHGLVIIKGAEQDNFLINKLICLCNSLSNIHYASSLFNRVSQPNNLLWNSFIKGHCEKSSFITTISVFNCMKQTHTLPDSYTFPSLIKSCSKALALREGKMIHGSVLRYGVDKDIFVGTSLIDLYGKCQEIESANKVFDEMPFKNEVSWTAMIVGYTNCGDLDSAQSLFDAMPNRNIKTWNALVSGYAKFGHLKKAHELFDKMPEKSVVAYTSLIVGYAQMGDIASARSLFDQTPDKDLVAWSALISGYVQNGQPNEALEVFHEMIGKHIKPDEFVMVGLISACSQLGSLELAKWAESYLNQMSINIQSVRIVAALIDMNAKCGNMERAIELFEGLQKKDLISYCSMIQGLSINQGGAQAIHLFDQMLAEGVIPDAVAFTVILTICGHSGFVEEGRRYFNCMKYEYSIVPSSDHFACMVNLLGRAGLLEEAYELIKSMPVEPNAGAWGALLGACSQHSNTELGEIVSGRLFEIEPQSGGSYVLLSNIYAEANRWSDVSNVRSKMRERGIRKLPGCSLVIDTNTDFGFVPQ